MTPQQGIFLIKVLTFKLFVAASTFATNFVLYMFQSTSIQTYRPKVRLS